MAYAVTGTGSELQYTVMDARLDSQRDTKVWDLPALLAIVLTAWRAFGWSSGMNRRTLSGADKSSVAEVRGEGWRRLHEQGGWKIHVAQRSTEYLKQPDPSLQPRKLLLAGRLNQVWAINLNVKSDSMGDVA